MRESRQMLSTGTQDSIAKFCTTRTEELTGNTAILQVLKTNTVQVKCCVLTSGINDLSHIKFHRRLLEYHCCCIDCDGHSDK